MAYDFGGTGSDDAIITNLTTHNDQRSYSIWTYREGDGEGSLGRIFDKRENTASIEFCFVFGSDNSYSFKRGFSGVDGEWTIAEPVVDEWHHLLITYDSTSTSNNPVMYLDGVSQTITEVAAPTGTADTNSVAFLIGNRKVATDVFNRTWDGRLCEWAVWDRILTAAEATSIGASKFSPLFYPNSLIRYSPLIREADDRLDSGTQTLNDTPTVFEHPPIIYPTQVITGFAAAAAAAAANPKGPLGMPLYGALGGPIA